MYPDYQTPTSNQRRSSTGQVTRNRRSAIGGNFDHAVVNSAILNDGGSNRPRGVVPANPRVGTSTSLRGPFSISPRSGVSTSLRNLAHIQSYNSHSGTPRRNTVAHQAGGSPRIANNSAPGTSRRLTFAAPTGQRHVPSTGPRRAPSFSPSNAGPPRPGASRRNTVADQPAGSPLDTASRRVTVAGRAPSLVSGHPGRRESTSVWKFDETKATCFIQNW